MSTLSDYNNNPGNLRPPKGVTYEGQIGVDDKGFAVFENKSFGQKALLNDITHKLDRGINTPEKFVDRFAPAGSENEEEARENYKIYLAQQLGLKSTNDPFPKDAAEGLVKAVSAFEGGTWATPASKDQKAPEGAPETPGEEGATVAPRGTSEIPGVSEAVKPALGVVGGVTGAGVAGTVETGKKVIPLVPNIINKLTSQEVDITRPVSRMSLQRYLNSQIAPNLRLPLTELEKVTGGNKIRTMSEVQQALDAIKAVEETKTAKPVVKMVPGRPGTFQETGMYRTSTTPGRPGIDLSQYEVKPSSPFRQALGRELQTAGEVSKSLVPSAGRIGLGALGGAGAMMSGYDAYELAQKIKREKQQGVKHKTIMGLTPDEWRLASKGAATVGGGMSMLPFGVTQIGGMALQAPEMAISGYEGLQNFINKALEEERPSLGNPMGAVGGLP